jgi:hypothetical protein
LSAKVNSVKAFFTLRDAEKAKENALDLAMSLPPENVSLSELL